MPKPRARLVAVAALALTLSGCAANTGPKKYNDDVKTNYTKACTEASQEKMSAADAAAYCECTYAAFSAPDGVPFKDFKAFDEAVRDEAGKTLKNAADLKAKFPKIVPIFEKCISAGPSLPTEGSTTTTAPTTSR